jgi:hypothetical protein
MAVIIGVLACGTTATNAPPASTSAGPSIQSPTETPVPEGAVEQATVPAVEPTAAQTQAVVRVDQPEFGTDVGKTLPQFEFTLIDGTKRSTAQLASQGKPVFLFFFATW